jgi:hypothetical protein
MGLSQTTVFLPDFAFVMVLKGRIYDFIPDLFVRRKISKNLSGRFQA